MKPLRIGYSIEPYPLAAEFAGKWALTIVKKIYDGNSLVEEPFHSLDREFDSEQEAREHAARWIARRHRS